MLAPEWKRPISVSPNSSSCGTGVFNIGIPSMPGPLPLPAMNDWLSAFDVELGSPLDGLGSV